MIKGDIYARTRQRRPPRNDEVREPTFFILTSLVQGEKHGYAIMADIADMTDGRVLVRAATVYSALERLVAEGRAVLTREEEVSGRARRYYEITDLGLQVVRSEVERLRMLANLVASKLRAR